MTDANIYRIIDAFREGKKVEYQVSPFKKNHVETLGGLLAALAFPVSDDHWFIDGLEAKG